LIQPFDHYLPAVALLAPRRAKPLPDSLSLLPSGPRGSRKMRAAGGGGGGGGGVFVGGLARGVAEGVEFGLSAPNMRSLAA